MSIEAQPPPATVVPPAIVFETRDPNPFHVLSELTDQPDEGLRCPLGCESFDSPKLPQEDSEDSLGMILLKSVGAVGVGVLGLKMLWEATKGSSEVRHGFSKRLPAPVVPKDLHDPGSVSIDFSASPDHIAALSEAMRQSKIVIPLEDMAKPQITERQVLQLARAVRMEETTRSDIDKGVDLEAIYGTLLKIKESQVNQIPSARLFGGRPPNRR